VASATARTYQPRSTLRFSQRAGADATARLELGRLAARVRLDVTKLPVRVDLVHGPVLWRPEAEHTATLVARDINLWRQLGALDPGRKVAGKLEIEGKFQGSMLAPDLSLALLGDGLRVRDGAIGQLRLDLRLRAQRAVLDPRSPRRRGASCQPARRGAAACRAAPRRDHMARG
jgi:hypothetical protein